MLKVTPRAISLLLVVSYFYSSPIFATNITDKLIGTLIEKKLPNTLYQHRDKPWDFGVYSLTVEKTGISNFSSDDKQLSVKLPLQITINGIFKQNLFGNKVSIGCNSQFLTDGIVDITPQIKPTNSEINASIDIPIPNPQLNCNGLKIPIKQALEQLIAEKKQGWENRMETEISKLFTQVGI